MAISERPRGCYLDLIFRGEPPSPYVVIGRVSTERSTGGFAAFDDNADATIEHLKEEACRAGAHGLLEVDTAGASSRNGRDTQTRGSAVVFVYVDPSGKPFPPPRGPRLIIHPGAAPAPAPTAAPVPPPAPTSPPAAAPVPPPAPTSPPAAAPAAPGPTATSTPASMPA